MQTKLSAIMVLLSKERFYALDARNSLVLLVCWLVEDPLKYFYILN